MKNIEYRNLKDLKLLENNPRKISKESMEQLIKSITDNPDYFEARPIILSDRTGELVIIAGNQRYKAAKKIGLKQVPTFLLSGLTEEREREIVIRDNVSNGEWDNDILRDEWGMCPLEDWGVSVDWKAEEEPKEAKEDDFSEEDAEQAPVICQKGDIWQLGEHRLMCGDSTENQDVEKLVGGGTVDLWLSDPPYNVAYQGGTKDKLTIANDNMSSDDFLEFLTKAFSLCEGVLKKGGAFYIWFASREHINFERALNKVGLQVRQELIWNKNALVLGRQDYQWKHEPCLYGWKEGATHYFIDCRTKTTVQEDSVELDLAKMKKEDMKRLLESILKSPIPTTIIDENKPTRNGEHPTMKPLKLIGRLILNSSRERESVLDTFGGSGSTMMACEQLNRKCYMMELDPHYCDVIIARWEKLTGKQAVKIN